tara:strand:- start:2121 stop:2519 length:399 start_codon:yes stop_codon:yes gene_type:complete
VKLIPNFAQLLHEIELPTPEKCFILEEGDEKFIEKWINNGKITCDLETLFDWLNIEYKLKKKNLTYQETKLAEEVKKRFPTDHWRIIKIFSDHQRKYRYYQNAIEDVKSRTTPGMNEQAIMTIFSPGWSINT